MVGLALRSFPGMVLDKPGVVSDTKSTTTQEEHHMSTTTGSRYMLDCGHHHGTVGNAVAAPFHAGGAPVTPGTHYVTCTDCGQIEMQVIQDSLQHAFDEEAARRDIRLVLNRVVPCTYATHSLDLLASMTVNGRAVTVRLAVSIDADS